MKVKGIHQARLIAKQHEHLIALAVASKLTGQGHTFDDEITQQRWVFDKNGDVIACRSRTEIDVATPRYKGHVQRSWGMFAAAVPECHTALTDTMPGPRPANPLGDLEVV